MSVLYCVGMKKFNRKDYAETWNIVDPWGRELGFKAQTYQVEWGIELSDSSYFGSTDSSKLEIQCQFNNAEKRFMAEVHATRNNESYGASPRARYFKTEEELEAYMVKYRKEAQKRAIKSAEKQNARRNKKEK